MLEIEGLDTIAGGFRLRDITLTAPGGSYGVLLGPPGSGKSVLVETICGLRRPVAGRIVIDGVDVTHDPPRDRRVGYVPQDYVLFPTKRVVDNIIYGLRCGGVSRQDAMAQSAGPSTCWASSISWTAGRARCPAASSSASRWLGRWPSSQDSSCSTSPSVRSTRACANAFCRDLRRFQRELGITTIHISHNLEEALAVSDWAAVLDDGELQQVGPMVQLLRRPRNEMVARFLPRREPLPRDGPHRTGRPHAAAVRRG